VSLTANVGLSGLAKSLDVMNAAEFAAYRNAYADVKAYYDGKDYTPLFNDPESYGAGTDWQDVLTRTGVTQGYKLAMNTGNSKGHAYFSFGYDNVTSSIGSSLYNGLSKRHLNHVVVSGGVEDILSVFSFGSHNAFYFAGGTSYAMNVAADQLGYVDGSRNGGYGLVAESGATAYVANYLRVYGSSYYAYSGSNLHIYNRLTIWNDYESNVG
jgi:hypothetical protein